METGKFKIEMGGAVKEAISFGLEAKDLLEKNEKNWRCFSYFKYIVFE